MIFSSEILMSKKAFIIVGAVVLLITSFAFAQLEVLDVDDALELAEGVDEGGVGDRVVGGESLPLGYLLFDEGKRIETRAGGHGLESSTTAFGARRAVTTPSSGQADIGISAPAERAEGRAA